MSEPPTPLLKSTVLAIFLIATVVFPVPGKALQPGSTYDIQDIQPKKKYFPPFFRKYLSVWDEENKNLRLRITETTNLQFPRRHKKLTLKHHDQVSLDENGYLENYVAGTPFPTGTMVSPDTLEPPRMAEKLYWNLHYKPRNNLMDRITETVTQNADGSARSIRSQQTYLTVRHRSETGPINPEWGGKAYFKRLTKLLDPADVKGIVSLFVYGDQSLVKSLNRFSYSYLPSRRQTIRNSTLRGCSPLGNTDHVRDDVLGYSGPFSWMNYEFKGTVERLAPFNISSSKQDFHPVSHYRDHATRGGIPNEASWQMRKMWVLELTPTEEHSDYCFSKKRLYIDVENYIIPYMEVWDAEGRPLKLGIGSARPNMWRGNQPWVALGWSGMFDLQRKHLTSTGSPEPFDTDVQVSPSDFSRSGLMKITN